MPCSIGSVARSATRKARCLQHQVSAGGPQTICRRVLRVDRLTTSPAYFIRNEKYTEDGGWPAIDLVSLFGSIESLNSTFCSKRKIHGGCPGFGLGIRVLGLTFLSSELLNRPRLARLALPFALLIARKQRLRFVVAETDPGMQLEGFYWTAAFRNVGALGCVEDTSKMGVYPISTAPLTACEFPARSR